MNIRHNLGRFASEVARALINFKYELTNDGVYLPGAKTFLGGTFRHAHAPVGQGFGPWAVDPNRVVTEGLIYLLNAAFAGQAPTSAFYIAPYSGNVAPAANWTGANFVANATEFVGYTAGARLPWTVPVAVSPSIGNSAAIAASTMTFSPGGPYNVYGLGLLEASAKSATSGRLIAATQFAVARTGMVAGDKLALEYIISAADAG